MKSELSEKEKVIAFIAGHQLIRALDNLVESRRQAGRDDIEGSAKSYMKFQRDIDAANETLDKAKIKEDK